MIFRGTQEDVEAQAPGKAIGAKPASQLIRRLADEVKTLTA